MNWIVATWCAASGALGQVDVYTSQSDFDAAAETALVCSFEEPAWDPFVEVNGPPSFLFNGIEFIDNQGNGLFVAPEGQVNFSVLPTSRVLTTSGNEDIDLVFQDPPMAVGFEFYANHGEPAVFTIELEGGELVVWESTQAPETLGYLGFVSSEPMARVNWVAHLGGAINTGIDNVSTDTATCAADINGDGVLNILDFVAFQNEWQGQSPDGDCDGDGSYNILDFVCYQGLFQAGC